VTTGEADITQVTDEIYDRATRVNVDGRLLRVRAGGAGDGRPGRRLDRRHGVVGRSIGFSPDRSTA